MRQLANGGTYVPRYRLAHVLGYTVAEPFYGFGQPGPYVSRLEQFQEAHRQKLEREAEAEEASRKQQGA